MTTDRGPKLQCTIPPPLILHFTYWKQLVLLVHTCVLYCSCHVLKYFSWRRSLKL